MAEGKSALTDEIRALIGVTAERVEAAIGIGGGPWARRRLPTVGGVTLCWGPGGAA